MILPDASTLLLFMTAALALNVTPGPDMLYVIAPLAVQMVSLGLLFNVSGTTVNVLVAILASGAGAWSRRRFGESLAMRRLTGVLFIGLGVRLALLERR